MIETFHFEGIIRIRRLPEDWTPEEYLEWWCGKTDGKGNIITPPRISEREKERYTELEVHNMLMVAGRTQALTYLGSSTGNSTAFSKYIALGTGALLYPTPVDTALVNEVFRKALASYTVQGTQVDTNFQLASADANYTLTEAGLFGGAAGGGTGSGTLMTHALFSYTKGAWGISVDYLLNLF